MSTINKTAVSLVKMSCTEVKSDGDALGPRLIKESTWSGILAESNGRRLAFSSGTTSASRQAELLESATERIPRIQLTFTRHPY